MVSERSHHGIVALNFIGETEKQLTFEMKYDSLQISAVSELGETSVQNPPEVIAQSIKKIIITTIKIKLNETQRLVLF